MTLFILAFLLNSTSFAESKKNTEPTPSILEQNLDYHLDNEKSKAAYHLPPRSKR
jgi:hypothetical protein